MLNIYRGVYVYIYMVSHIVFLSQPKWLNVAVIAVVAVVEAVAVVVVMEVVHRCLRTAEKRDVNITPYENKLFEAEQALEKP